jgi:hypothetical protein
MTGQMSPDRGTPLACPVWRVANGIIQRPDGCAPKTEALSPQLYVKEQPRTFSGPTNTLVHLARILAENDKRS